MSDKKIPKLVAANLGKEKERGAMSSTSKRNTLNREYNAQAQIMQAFYAPNPDEIAYVAFSGQGCRDKDGAYEILVSPRRYSPRGIWYADRLPGRWPTERQAQEALDDLADEEGWRYIRLDA